MSQIIRFASLFVLIAVFLVITPDSYAQKDCSAKFDEYETIISQLPDIYDDSPTLMLNAIAYFANTSLSECLNGYAYMSSSYYPAGEFSVELAEGWWLVEAWNVTNFQITNFMDDCIEVGTIAVVEMYPGAWIGDLIYVNSRCILDYKVIDITSDMWGISFNRQFTSDELSN